MFRFGCISELQAAAGAAIFSLPRYPVRTSIFLSAILSVTLAS